MQSAPDTPTGNKCSPVAVAEGNEDHSYRVKEYSPESPDTDRNSVTGLRRFFAYNLIAIRELITTDR